MLDTDIRARPTPAWSFELSFGLIGGKHSLQPFITCLSFLEEEPPPVSPLRAVLGEAFLPTPDAGFGLARPAHDLGSAEVGSRQEHDRGPPDMLLVGVAVADDRLQTAAVEDAQ